MNTSQPEDRSQANELLLRAARAGRLLEYVTAMVSADIQHQDENGDTALILAAGEGHVLLVEQMLIANALVETENKEGITALLAASRNGHLQIVDELLKQNANVQHQCRNGNNALHYAVLGGHEEVARKLLSNGADPSQNNNDGQGANMLVSQGSSLLSEFAAHSERERLAESWHRARNEGITKENLLQVLEGSYLISSLDSFVIVHNLILLCIRQGAVALDEARMLRGNRDLLLEKVYLPVSKLDISHSGKSVVSLALHHAEMLGLIRAGYGALVKLAYDLRSEIRENRLELQAEVVSIVRRIGRLDQRVSRLEGWAENTVREFERLARNQSQLIEDMKRMNASLKHLYKFLRRQERLRKYAAVVGFVLAAIPMVGGLVGGATVLGSEMFMGLNMEAPQLFSLPRAQAQITPYYLDVDLSNMQIAEAIVSQQYLSQVGADERERIECVVKHSDFKTVECLQRELRCAVESLGADETQMLESQADGELRQRFQLVANRAHMDSANASHAAAELQSYLQSRAQVRVEGMDVLLEVVRELDHEGRIDCAGFMRAYKEVFRKHVTNAKREVPRELRERFLMAAAPNCTLPIVVARHVLRVMFDESSGRGTANCSLCFRRVEKAWEDEEVSRLFEECSEDGLDVNEEAFIEVSMKVLFEAR